MKKVSVIIPFKQDRGWLKQAINSVERQTYPNIELIIQQGNMNVSTNINRGIERSTGDFIKYLCDDDLLPPKSIEHSLKAFKYPATKFIHGNAISFRGDIVSTGVVFKPIYKHITFDNMIVRNHVHGGTLMYKRECFENHGMFNESLFTGEEYELNLRLLHKGLKSSYIDEVLAYYRLHENQKSIGNTNKEYQRLRQAHVETFKNWYR